MNQKRPQNRTSAFLVVLVIGSTLALLTACATVRKATYPPNFVYLDTTEVQSAMQTMAISIDSLDVLLKQSGIDPGEKNSRVIEELDKIRTATDGMGANASISSHRVISDNMGSFRARVSEAKIAASSENPNYSLSGRLVAECLSCHVKNANDNRFF